MQQPSLTEVAAQMVQTVIARGQQPVAFMLNEATAKAIADLTIGNAKQRISVLSRFWLWFAKRNIQPRLEFLCGVPVIVTPTMQDGGIFLQAMARGPVQQEVADKQAASVVPAEFLKREPVADSASPCVGEVRPTLDDLSKGDGDRPSSSDVLMKAMENVDDLIGVVVVRVHRNNDIDLCLNTNQFETQGILQKAQQWLMMRGY